VNSRIFLIAPVLLTSVVARGPAFAAQPILEQVRQANRSTLDSIHTFSCRMTTAYTSLGVTETPVQVQYWRSQDAVRLRYTVGGKAVDCFAKDSIVRTLGELDKSRFSGAVVPGKGRFFSEYDVWQLSLLAFPLVGKDRDVLPFDQMLSRGQKIGAVDRRTEDGHEYIVVELVDPKLPRELWFDPSVNYLIRKYVSHQSKGSVAAATVTRFVEAAPAIFFPEQVEMKAIVDGKQDDSRSTTFSEIRINEPLPPSIFDFQFPGGTEVNDYSLGKSYVTGVDGKPAGELRDLNLAGVSVAAVAGGDVTAAESESWSGWILPVSIAFLCMAGLLWARRTWSASKPA
jgi:outer membrane lipoprotein-sorting protein